MQIDWFTLVAQIVNFLILLYLLKRVLYGPILAAVDRRQRSIEQGLQEAGEIRRQAQEELEAHRREHEAFARGRDEMLQEVDAEAQERRREMERQIREDMAGARRRWEEAIEREKREYLADLRERVGRRVFATARRALADLAGEDLEQRIVTVFLERLQSDDGRARVAAELAAAPAVRLCSSFELDDRLARRVVEAVRQIAGNPVLEVELETDPSVICGIELRAPGLRVAWSVRDHLESLEELFFSSPETVAELEPEVLEEMSDGRA